MKILFVTQCLDFQSPLGLMQISAVAKQKGHQSYLAVLSKENLLDKIQEIEPQIVAYSSTTGEHKNYTEINKKVIEKYPEIITTIGGPHPTFFPIGTSKEGKFHAVFVGESDYTFPEFLEKVEKRENFSGLENIMTLEMAEKRQMPKLKPLIQDFDSLPFPDRDLFYGQDVKRDKALIMNFMTSRGCPYKCTYCYNIAYNKMYSKQKYVRKHSVDYVINEIKNAKDKFDFRYLKFDDDIFVFKEDAWLEEFSDKYPKEINLPFNFHMRFNLFTPKIARLLKKAGGRVVHMSIESTNQRIREDILERKISNEKIINGARLCKEEGLILASNTMLGLPKSKLEDDIDAVDFSIKSGVSITFFPTFQPYPKTELGEMCTKDKLFDGNMSKMEMYGLTHPSLLNCFTKREKNAQVNISLLGPLVVQHPYLRNLVLNYLIHLPTNKLFEKIHDLEKMIVFPSKVYKMKYSLKERFNILKKGFKLEKVKRD